ncbi:MAG: HTH domain-containing protein [Syntrophobacteraceae bacterium]|jgi:hypothetical protein
MADRNQIIAYKKALEAAEKERDSVLARLLDLEALQKRVARLDSTIEGLKALIGTAQTESQTASTESTSSQTPDQEHVRMPPRLIRFPSEDKTQTGEFKRFEQAEQILRKSGQSMSLTQIAHKFLEYGWLLNKKTAVQIVRNALIRKIEKGEVFNKNAEGLIGLIEWQSKEPETIK